MDDDNPLKFKVLLDFNRICAEYNGYYFNDSVYKASSSFYAVLNRELESGDYEGETDHFLINLDQHTTVVQVSFSDHASAALFSLKFTALLFVRE